MQLPSLSLMAVIVDHPTAPALSLRLTHTPAPPPPPPDSPPAPPPPNSEAHEAMGVVADTLTLEEVNAAARSLLTFASDVGREADMLGLAAQPDQEGLWARPGPTRWARV
jgi:hypothetical protein